MTLLLTLVLLMVPISHAMAVEGSQPTADGAVKADVMYWEGEELVVKEMTGHEKRLRVTPETKIVGVVSRLKTGDKIHAQVTPEGRALSITLQIPESGAGVVPPGTR
jgi:hypothetical protein